MSQTRLFFARICALISFIFLEFVSLDFLYEVHIPFFLVSNNIFLLAFACTTVLEEFLHGTQAGLGIIERRGIGFAEIHVKRFMIRQPIRLHLHSGDLQALDILLEREIDRWRI